MLVCLCAISNAISLPGPNTTSGSDLDQTPVKGIYLHLSSNTSSQNLASQFDVYYYGNDANGTLGKRAVARPIRCSGKFWTTEWPVNDPNAQSYVPFGPLPRPADVDRPQDGDYQARYVHVKSWCNPDRDKWAWTCQRKRPINFMDEARGMRYDVGRCADDEECFDWPSAPEEPPVARCMKSDDVKQLKSQSHP